ncbi:MAG: SusD/RagB family nutrient-binding outer membrane lipoprotein [Massilibacteroides sp.]|nr:SusD/RagB family nutrient-binding outer membrane lipoprotein [Massilibacteroides sp.]MDD3063572.1 SusD/RagB family nutrient-binding outer membrane lipoprotein [Massilibacteroides sp.]MDD4114245.1 SusD/RagB family nutrient-binding outer membrane lipoprotein [Massilibacteroides sp.]MDD4660997.1 SusD/RagB family nutrient-binding outer membrane lipoprotein [Massilibacteroides sp.]
MKTKIKICFLAIVLAGTSFLTSCESFDSLNENPNSPTPEKIDPVYLLSPVFIRSVYNVDLYQRIHNLYVDTYAQYFSNDKYSSNVCVPYNDWTQQYWDAHWGWIANLNEVIRICEDNPKRNNLMQVARIWRVWAFGRATDLFGDIPYSKACDDSGEAAPYDPQKDIYYDMVKELTEASAALDPSGDNLGTGDLIFGGNVARWKAFANSLRLRLAMRMTEVDPDKAKTEAEAAVQADGGLLSSITEDVKIVRKNAYYQFDYGYYNGVSHLFNGGRMTMSYSMQKLLTNLGGISFPKKDSYKEVPEYCDPRGPIYFNVTNEYNGAGEAYRGRWKGVPAGYTKAVSLELDNVNKNNSRVGVYFVGDTKETDVPFTVNMDRDQTLMYYSEVCFLRAEGALRGWNMGGSAQNFYEEGIKASMKEVEISDEVITQYLQSDMPNMYGTSVLFDDTKGENNSQLDKVITQKYLSGFPDNSWEAWADYRRLSLPTLDPFAMPESGYVIEKGAMGWKGSLRRIIYPAKEVIVNEANYNEAVARIGGDKTTTRMWWDAQK